MAAHPIAVVHDGIVEIPDDVKTDPRFQNGARLQLVPLSPEVKSVLERLEQLAGSWVGSRIEPNAVLEAERQKELTDEARWRG